MTQRTKVGMEYPPVVLYTSPALEMNEEQFFEFCQLNRDWRIERSAEGALEIRPPTGGETSNRNAELSPPSNGPRHGGWHVNLSHKAGCVRLEPYAPRFSCTV